MEEICKDFHEYDQESLAQIDLTELDDQLLEEDDQEEEDEENDEASDIELDRRVNKNIKNTYKRTYGKTKRQIDAENRHILGTQKKCLNFVKRHRGHRAVCNWCKKAPTPKVIWKWASSEKVWYRWYRGKWHYWGPSKRGFTESGWTWYKGYWHHDGYVFKFVNHKWYRFQGKRWVYYGRKVAVHPGVPRGKPICRPFYILKRWGFPSKLGVRKLPRCQVGKGRHSGVYMWKGRSACRFLGGRLVYHKHKICKTGRPHQWKRVKRCVKGNILTKKGLNYKTGRALRTHTRLVIGGLVENSCYKFRAFEHSKDYLAYRYKHKKYEIYQSPKSRLKDRVWKIKRGIYGAKNTITLQSSFWP